MKRGQTTFCSINASQRDSNDRMRTNVIGNYIDSNLRLIILPVTNISRNRRKYWIDSILTDIPNLISKSEVMNGWILTDSPSSFWIHVSPKLIGEWGHCICCVFAASNQCQNRFLKAICANSDVISGVKSVSALHVVSSINDTYVSKEPNSHMNNVCGNKFIMCLLIWREKNRNTTIQTLYRCRCRCRNGWVIAMRER